MSDKRVCSVCGVSIEVPYVRPSSEVWSHSDPNDCVKVLLGVRDTMGSEVSRLKAALAAAESDRDEESKCRASLRARVAALEGALAAERERTALRSTEPPAPTARGDRCPTCSRPRWDGGHAMNERECDEQDGEVCRLHARLNTRSPEPKGGGHNRKSDLCRRCQHTLTLRADGTWLCSANGARVGTVYSCVLHAPSPSPATDPERIEGKVAERFCNKCGAHYTGVAEHPGCHYFAPTVHHHNPAPARPPEPECKEDAK